MKAETEALTDAEREELELLSGRDDKLGTIAKAWLEVEDGE